MFKSLRKLTLAGLLAGSVGVPYVVSTGGKLDSVRQWWNSTTSRASTLSVDELARQEPALDPALFAMPGQPPQKKEFAPPSDLTTVFRFDITINWIMFHWPAVSSVSTDAQMQGFRVPLVSGINEDDVAGSLTYYFGPDRRLQRITFEGSTGNADKLIQQVATPHELVQRQSNDLRVFLYQRPGINNSVSELRIRPADVVTAAAAHRRFQVSLVLTPPVEGGWF